MTRRRRIDYDGKVFRTAANAVGGDVDDRTTFHYRQRGDVVWATYEGGAIAAGTLVAAVKVDDSLDLRYQHLTVDGTFKAGRCRSQPTPLPDGRICLDETWQWTEGGEGTGRSVVEEVTPVTDDRLPLLYTDLSDWWPLLSAPEDYEEEATFYQQVLERSCAGVPRTLLELGSGGGNNASFLKRRFEMTLVDRSAGMLTVSGRLNPECAHLIGDMRDVRLGRNFDAVFVHDAVCYLTTEDDLRRAMATAFAHCAPGGAAVFAPDHVRETFAPSTDHGGHDSPDGRGLRYLEWVWDPDPTDGSYFADYTYTLRDPSGAVRVVHDRHVEGLFPRDTWLGLLRDVGFEPEAVRFDHSELEPGTYTIFVGRKARR